MSEQASTPYTAEQWAQIVDDRPLNLIDAEQLGLLHRHWLWADHGRRWFDRALTERPSDLPVSPKHMYEEWGAAMYVWYGLLWSVIDGLTLRRARLQGGLRDDVRRVREPLRQARNAVFHVGDGYFDDRLFEPMRVEESAVVIRRAHHGIGNLILDEMQYRNSDAG